MSFIEPKQGVPVSISTVCVYCGSSNLVPQDFKTVARDVGLMLAQHKMQVVYGGGHVGLMGIVADTALQAGAKVVGIIPEHIRSQEVQHDKLTELHIVPDMHTRKRMMVERSDAFVILPGGLGTLDECFEIMTWKKLGLHNKPIIVFNHDHYWDPLLALFEKTVTVGFSRPVDWELFKTVTDVAELNAALHENNTPKAPVQSEQM